MTHTRTPADRFSQLPSSLAKQTKIVRLGDIPALLAHPDWETPAPTVLWLHGRTVHKELDPGRYLRWLRAGIATCAIDLPGHGERYERELQQQTNTLHIMNKAVGEIDGAIESILASEYNGVFDATKLAIGGMSAGGMVTLRRLGDPHPFICAAVEAAVGDFSTMPEYEDRYTHELIDELNPILHMQNRKPVPLLALHSEKDEWVPIAGIRNFIDAVRPMHEAANVDLTLHTWPETGAPYEHAGFGKVAAEAKDLQLAFFKKAFNLI